MNGRLSDFYPNPADANVRRIHQLEERLAILERIMMTKLDADAADALFLTPAEGDALFLTPSEGDSAYVNVGGDTMTGALLMPDGSTSAPAVAFSGDTNTGIRRVSADYLALVAGAADRLGVNGAEIVIPGAVQVPTIRSNAAAAATKVDGTTVAPMYAMRQFSATLTGSDVAFTNQTGGNEVTLLTINVTTVRANALCLVVGNMEAKITATGTGLCVVACEFDDVQTGDNINFPYATTLARDPHTRAWFGTFASAGAHTIKMSIRKTVNDGTINAGVTNTNLLAMVFE